MAENINTEAGTPAEPFISKRELARRLKKTTRTINNWMAQGWLPYYRLGQAVVFIWSEVEAILRKHKNIPMVRVN